MNENSEQALSEWLEMLRVKREWFQKGDFSKIDVQECLHKMETLKEKIR